MFKLRLPVLLFLFFSSNVIGQSNAYVALDIATHNLVKHNRYLRNPTFSIIGEKSSRISLYNRRQWVDFDNSPALYMLNYSGLVSEKVGVGIQIYQQNVGVLKNFGVMANYAYRLKFSEKMAVTLGFNASYLISGINGEKVFIENPDPALQAMDDHSLFLFMPGINFTIGRFELGLYAENIVDYNFKTSETLTEFKDKTYTGHLMYTHPFKNTTGVLQDMELQIMAINRNTPYRGNVLSGNLLLDMPKLGWFQGGYNDFYGYSVGLGVHVTKNISFGYLVERGVSKGLKNLGSTHEITIAYSFDPQKRKSLSARNKELKENALLEEDLQKLKKDIDDLKVNQVGANISRLEKLKELQSKKEREAGVNKSQLRIIKGEVSPNTHDASGVAYQYLGKVPGVDKGYYVVTKVFSDTLLAKKAVEKLNIKPTKSAYFFNSNNGYSYVYLDVFLSWEKVKEIVKSRYDDSYDNHLWIMDVAEDKKKSTVLTPKPSAKTAPVSKTHISTVIKEKQQEEAPLLNPHKISKARKPPKNLPVDITDVASGYYLIASVFSVETNASNFLKKLKEKGLDARFFVNPKNNYRYVYLKYSKEKAAMLKSYYSNVNDRYFEDMWVMHVVSKKKRVIANSKPLVKMKIQGVASGYYIVVGVFSKQHNATRFLDKLKKNGFDARFFVNPKNNYQYIYIEHSIDRASIAKSYTSNLNNTYFKEKWICSIENN
ncbi:MAG: PorP/SprF family type IX secretion system membrane protein [Flavobacteriaceae bacterium]|nr:PorP/SprF family type IX secretion system membrane protein [Flavobacteriaceae bacterium]